MPSTTLPKGGEWKSKRQRSRGRVMQARGSLRRRPSNLTVPSNSRAGREYGRKGKFVNRYMAGRERIVDKVSCFVDIEESCIDS